MLKTNACLTKKSLAKESICPSQREEKKLKRLLRENEQLRAKKESSLKILANLGEILDICCDRMTLKYEYECKQEKKFVTIEKEIKRLREVEAKFKVALNRDNDIGN